MYQVNPNENIQIAYLFADPTDVTVYFVKAVMRNTASGAIVGSVNLTMSASNTRRFTGQLAAPANTSAAALYIDITATPYTDNTYTTQLTTYPETIQLYQVAQRWSYALAGGGGGGSGFANFDWTKLLKLLKDVLTEHQKVILKKMVSSRSEPDFDALREALMADLTGVVESTTTKGHKLTKAAIEESVKALGESQEVTLKKVFGAGRTFSKVSDSRTKLGLETEEPVELEAPVEEAPAAAPEPEPLFQPAKSGRQPSAGIVPSHILERNKFIKK